MIEIVIHVLLDSLLFLTIAKSAKNMPRDFKPKNVFEMNYLFFDFSIILLTLLVTLSLRVGIQLFTCSAVQWLSLFYRTILGLDIVLQQVDRMLAVHWPLHYADLVTTRCAFLACVVVKLLAALISSLDIILSSPADCVMFDVGYLCPCISVFHTALHCGALFSASVSLVIVSLFCFRIKRKLERQVQPLVSLPTVSGNYLSDVLYIESHYLTRLYYRTNSAGIFDREEAELKPKPFFPNNSSQPINIIFRCFLLAV